MSDNQLNIIGDPSLNIKYYYYRTLTQQKSNIFFNSRRFAKISQLLNITWTQIQINPQSTIKLLWDSLILLLLFINLLYVPISIAFQIQDENQSRDNLVINKRINTMPSSLMMLISDVPIYVFITDIMLGFITQYYQKGIMIENFQKIVRNYIKTQFFWDLISTFPFIMKNYINSEYLGIILLFRITQISKILDSIESSISLEGGKLAFYQFLKLFLLIFFVAHYCGCAFYLSAQISDNDTIDSWINKLQIKSQDWKIQYLVSLYWAVITMITVGYGDITPVSNIQRGTVIGITLMSCGVFAYSLNQIGVILEEVRKRDQKFKSKMQNITGYLRNQNLSRELLMKVQRYYEYLHCENAANAEIVQDYLKKELHSQLRSEVLTDINFKQINQHKELKLHFSEQFLKRISPEFREQILGPEEQLLIPGEINNRLYLLVSGKVISYATTKKTVSENMLHSIKEYQTKQIFGMNSFFIGGAKEQLGAMSKQVVRILFIEFQEFYKIIKNYPDDWEKLCQIKDDILFKGKSFGITYKCEVCKNFNHNAVNCPLVHYEINKDTYFSQIIRGNQMVSRKKFNRSKNRRDQTILKSLNCAEKAIEFLVHEGENIGLQESIINEGIQNIESANNIKFLTSKGLIEIDIQGDNLENIQETIIQSNKYITDKIDTTVVKPSGNYFSYQHKRQEINNLKNEKITFNEIKNLENTQKNLKFEEDEQKQKNNINIYTQIKQGHNINQKSRQIDEKQKTIYLNQKYVHKKRNSENITFQENKDEFQSQGQEQLSTGNEKINDGRQEIMKQKSKVNPLINHATKEENILSNYQQTEQSQSQNVQSINSINFDDQSVELKSKEITNQGQINTDNYQFLVNIQESFQIDQKCQFQKYYPQFNFNNLINQSINNNFVKIDKFMNAQNRQKSLITSKLSTYQEKLRKFQFLENQFMSLKNTSQIDSPQKLQLTRNSPVNIPLSSQRKSLKLKTDFEQE